MYICVLLYYEVFYPFIIHITCHTEHTIICTEFISELMCTFGLCQHAYIYMWVYVLYTHTCARTCMHIISVRICARICTPVYAYVRMSACMRVDRTSHGLVSVRDSDSLADREHGQSVPSGRFPSPEPESPQLPADLNLKQTQCLSSHRNTSGNSMKLSEAKSREISSRFTRKIVAYRNSFPDTIVTARNTNI